MPINFNEDLLAQKLPSIPKTKFETLENLATFVKYSRSP